MSRLALVIDFDGTMTMNDVGLTIITEFGAEGWREGDEKYKSGEFGSRELHEWETRFLPSAKAEEMTRTAVEKAVLRPGFRELLQFAREQKIPVEIASSGWGFYIRAILKEYGLDGLPFTAAEAHFDQGEFARHDLSPGASHCEINGICKCDRVRPYQESGDTVIFVGDGLSDYCVASQADVLFARRSLAKHCTQEGIEFTPFEDFFEVLEGVKELVKDSA